MDHGPLLQRGPQGPVEAVLEVHLTVPLDDVGEQIAVIGGVFGEQGVEVQRSLGGDELVKADLPRGQFGPGAQRGAVFRVGPPVAHALEDHLPQSIRR